MKTKRRLIKIFAAAFVALFALCCLLGFAACGDETSATVSDDELAETKTKLEETEAELADTKSELDDAKAKLKEAEAKIEELEGSYGSSTQSSSGDLSYATYYDGSGYMVTGIGEWTDPDLVIPAEHNGVPVVAIAPYAFYLYNFLTSVTIPESVEVIGDYAFYECGLTEIHYNAVNAHRSYYGDPPYSSYDGGKGFYYAGTEGKDLTLTIGSNVKSIPEWLFCYSNITSMVFEENSQCESIGDYAFYDCTSLTSVTIPEGVTSIGSYAFGYCTSLTSVTIPGSVESIGDSAFYGCSSLTSVTIQAGVTSIGSYAFCNCTSLTSVTIEDGIESIGRQAFNNCFSLTCITIPEGVKSIGDSAFYHCSSLTAVYYGGMADEWTALQSSIGSYNTALTSATIYYYSETEPTDSGNWWRYVDGEIVVWGSES